MPDEREAGPTLRALGLCAKAGRLVCGTALICEALRGRNRPLLVLEAADNSENTAKRLRDRCAFYGVPLVRLPVSDERLAGALGKNGRIAAAAVTDRQLCKLVRGTLRPAPDTLEEEHNL